MMMFENLLGNVSGIRTLRVLRALKSVGSLSLLDNSVDLYEYVQYISSCRFFLELLVYLIRDVN